MSPQWLLYQQTKIYFITNDISECIEEERVIAHTYSNMKDHTFERLTVFIYNMLYIIHKLDYVRIKVVDVVG